MDLIFAILNRPASDDKRRFVGQLAAHGQTRRVPIGGMFALVEDNTKIGVDTADYSNGGL